MHSCAHIDHQGSAGNWTRVSRVRDDDANRPRALSKSLQSALSENRALKLRIYYINNTHCIRGINIEGLIASKVIWSLEKCLGLTEPNLHSQKDTAEMGRRFNGSVFSMDWLCYDLSNDLHFHYTFYFNLRMENLSKQVRNGTFISKRDTCFESVAGNLEINLIS